MDNEILKDLIIFGIIIIIAAIVFSFVFSPSSDAHNTSIQVLNKGDLGSNSTIYVKLTDSQGNPISNQTINIKLIYKNGTAIDKKTATNSKGKAKFTMEENGKYSVECRFDGNDKYASSSITDNITVEKATTKVVSEEQTSTTTHASKNAPDGGIYPEYGPEVDSQGITREYAIAHDMHYIEMRVDGDRPGEYVTVGGYTARDPNNGLYHT